MKIAIYSRGNEQELKEELNELTELLSKNNIDVLLHFSLARFVKANEKNNLQFFHHHNELNTTVDFLISLGGDGTILDTVTLVRNKNIPILGINYGRLGFLAGIGKT